VTGVLRKTCPTAYGPRSAIPLGGDRTTAIGSLADRPLYVSTA